MTTTADREAKHQVLLARIPEGEEWMGEIASYSGFHRLVSREGYRASKMHRVLPWSETSYRLTDLYAPIDYLDRQTLPARWDDDGAHPVEGEHGWVKPLTEGGEQRWPDGTVVEMWWSNAGDGGRALAYVSGTGWDSRADGVGVYCPVPWRFDALIRPVLPPVLDLSTYTGHACLPDEVRLKFDGGRMALLCRKCNEIVGYGKNLVKREDEWVALTDEQVKALPRGTQVRVESARGVAISGPWLCADPDRSVWLGSDESKINMLPESLSVRPEDVPEDDPDADLIERMAKGMYGADGGPSWDGASGEERKDWLDIARAGLDIARAGLDVVRGETE